MQFFALLFLIRIQQYVGKLRDGNVYAIQTGNSRRQGTEMMFYLYFSDKIFKYNGREEGINVIFVLVDCHGQTENNQNNILCKCSQEN